jgi:hypothetical protein
MLEAILEFLGEFLLQALIQALVELGFHAVAEPFRKSPNPVVAAAGYMLLGVIFGILSLWAVPSHLAPGAWRVANLVFTPLVIGFFMLLVGSWRAKHGLSVLRIERFAYGYLFALGVALVRFFVAK